VPCLFIDNQRGEFILNPFLVSRRMNVVAVIM